MSCHGLRKGEQKPRRIVADFQMSSKGWEKTQNNKVSIEGPYVIYCVSQITLHNDFSFQPKLLFEP